MALVARTGRLARRWHRYDTTSLLCSSQRLASVLERSQISRRGFTASSDGLRDLIDVSPEVKDAIESRRPVVALESTIYTHGALGQDLPSVLDSLVRSHGAVPATIGVLDGIPKVGLTPEEIERMVSEGARKISRRDFAHIVGLVCVVH